LRSAHFLIPLLDLLPINLYLGWGTDSKLNTIATGIQDYQANAAINHNLLAALAGQDKHDVPFHEDAN
jgi:hypothetical protein